MKQIFLLMVVTTQLINAQMTVLTAEGQVLVRTGTSGAFRAVNLGDILPPNATVLTRENSRAVLVSRDGATHVLRPDSRLVVPAVSVQTSSSLYEAAIAKSQNRQRTRLSMTQVGATRAEDSSEPLKNQVLSEEQRNTLTKSLATLHELGLTGSMAALAQGALLEEFKQWAEAERVYTQALDAEPTHQGVRDALVDLYFQQGRVQRARRVLESRS